MYTKGMTTSDIERHIHDIYCVEVSDTTVSRVTDQVPLQENGSNVQWKQPTQWYLWMRSIIMCEMREADRQTSGLEHDLCTTVCILC